MIRRDRSAPSGFASAGRDARRSTASGGAVGSAVDGHAPVSGPTTRCSAWRRTASPDEIRRAHRQLARVLHPDRLAGSSPAERALAERRMREVNAAWTTLSDPARRADYDRELAGRAPAATTVRTPARRRRACVAGLDAARGRRRPGPGLRPSPRRAGRPRRAGAVRRALLAAAPGSDRGGGAGRACCCSS